MNEKDNTVIDTAQDEIEKDEAVTAEEQEPSDASDKSNESDAEPEIQEPSSIDVSALAAEYDNKERYVSKKLFTSMLIVVILCVCLSISSFAMALYSSAYMRDNTFTTGTLDVEIEQKNNISIVEKIAPGMSFDKTFTVVNNSPIDIYYMVYFENIGGKLDDTIQITVTEKNDDGDVILYEGLAKEFISANHKIKAGELIPANSSRDIVITYTFPEISGNDYQSQQLTFDITVKAVQAKNNPDKEFD